MPSSSFSQWRCSCARPALSSWSTSLASSRPRLGVDHLEISKVPGFKYQRRGDRRGRLRTIASAFDNHRHRQLRSLQRSDAQEPTINSRMFFIHNGLFIFANDVALVVFLHPMPGFHFTCFATGINSCRFNWTKNSARRTTRTAGHQPHYAAQRRCHLRRHHLLEDFRRPVEFDFRLHQSAVHIGNRRSGEGHLKWSHLTSITLAIAHQGQVVSGDLLAGDYRSLTRRQGPLNGVRAGVPDLGLLSAAQGFDRRVVCSDTEKLRRLLQANRSELDAHLREILIAGNLISGIDSNAAMHFAWTAIIEDNVCPRRGVKATPTAGELRALLACEKRSSHGYRLEGRARNVVSAQCATH